jgi:hypothetical protein
LLTACEPRVSEYFQNVGFEHFEDRVGDPDGRGEPLWSINLGETMIPCRRLSLGYLHEPGNRNEVMRVVDHVLAQSYPELEELLMPVNNEELN